MTRHFTYAVQIQPRNGQELTEYHQGIDLEGARPWSESNRKRFPQADRQCREGFALIVSGDNVFCVPAEEL